MADGKEILSGNLPSDKKDKRNRDSSQCSCCRTRSSKYSIDAKTRVKKEESLSDSDNNGKDKRKPSGKAAVYATMKIIRTAGQIASITPELAGTFTSNDQISNSLGNTIGTANQLGSLAMTIASGNPVAIALTVANIALNVAKEALNNSKQNLSKSVETSRATNRIGYSETGYSR